LYEILFLIKKIMKNKSKTVYLKEWKIGAFEFKIKIEKDINKYENLKINKK
jgi:hypothetical protein